MIMKNIKNYINEKLIISKKLKDYKYSCQPKDWNELRKIIEDRLAKDKNADLNDIDVSQIKDLEGLFLKLDPHNIDISEWDVSNVENMERMFSGCTNFAGNSLENWDVSNVKDMYYMFFSCYNFNCDLSKWDISNVENMTSMFSYCRKFEGKGLENWDVSNVKTMTWIFNGCKSLKNKPSWYEEYIKYKI